MKQTLDTFAHLIDRADARRAREQPHGSAVRDNARVTRFAFRFGDFFPEDSVLAEWAATVALAFNDVSLVHARMEEDAETEYKWFYWLRLGMAHFAEAATYLRDTRDVAEVTELVASLTPQAQAHYERCLTVYTENEEAIKRIRNEAGFHYPRLRIVDGQRRRRPMQRVLAALADARSSVIIGTTIRNSRLLFADDVAATQMLRAVGGDALLQQDDAAHREALEAVYPQIEDGIAAFIRFANPALEEYFRRVLAQGATWQAVP